MNILHSSSLNVSWMWYELFFTLIACTNCLLSLYVNYECSCQLTPFFFLWPANPDRRTNKIRQILLIIFFVHVLQLVKVSLPALNRNLFTIAKFRAMYIYWEINQFTPRYKNVVYKINHQLLNAKYYKNITKQTNSQHIKNKYNDKTKIESDSYFSSMFAMKYSIQVERTKLKVSALFALAYLSLAVNHLAFNSSFYLSLFEYSLFSNKEKTNKLSRVVYKFTMKHFADLIVYN